MAEQELAQARIALHPHPAPAIQAGHGRPPLPQHPQAEGFMAPWLRGGGRCPRQEAPVVVEHPAGHLQQIQPVAGAPAGMEAEELLLDGVAGPAAEA